MGVVDADTDQKVVAAVLAGDRDRFAALVERYQVRVFNAMWRLAGSRYEAEELTQAAFCRAYFALHTFKPEYRFSTWLFQIAFNLAISAHQRQQRTPLAESPTAGPDPLDLVPDDPAGAPEAVAERRAQEAMVRRAWQMLGTDARLMIEMRYVQQLSIEEISQATGLPLGTVKSRLARARRRLAEILSGEPD